MVIMVYIGVRFNCLAFHLLPCQRLMLINNCLKLFIIKENSEKLFKFAGMPEPKGTSQGISTQILVNVHLDILKIHATRLTQKKIARSNSKISTTFCEARKGNRVFVVNMCMLQKFIYYKLEGGKKKTVHHMSHTLPIGDNLL